MISLLEHALTKKPKRVIDFGVGTGIQAKAFIGIGATVTGVDMQLPSFEHENYSHLHSAIECVTLSEEGEPYDLVWSSYTLECMPNVHNHLVQMHDFLNDDGWAYIAVSTGAQERLHFGRLTLWTPALLMYNMICAGWDCSNARWYTSGETIGLCVQKKLITDMSWRNATEREEIEANRYLPVKLRHECGAWIENNWFEPLPGRVIDPPLVTVGVYQTNLPPKTQLAFGPNPALKRSPGTAYRAKDGPTQEDV